MRKFIILFAVLLLLCSCSLLNEAKNQLADPVHETITLELPEWPEYLPELNSWQIRVYTAATTKNIPQTSLKIKVERNKPACIIAQPVIQTSQGSKNYFFKCAGTLYPYAFSGTNNTIKLTWHGGYAATLMKSIFNSGAQAGYSQDFTEEIAFQFNWERLLETLEQNQEQNPWLLDMQQVLEGIAYHNFSANKLKTSGTLSVELDFPVFSSYIPENEAIRQQNQPNQYFVTVKKDKNALFALNDGNFATGVLIYGTSIKNISLEFISLPIYIIEEI